MINIDNNVQLYLSVLHTYKMLCQAERFTKATFLQLISCLNMHTIIWTTFYMVTKYMHEGV